MKDYWKGEKVLTPEICMQLVNNGKVLGESIKYAAIAIQRMAEFETIPHLAAIKSVYVSLGIALSNLEQMYYLESSPMKFEDYIKELPLRKEKG